MRKDITFHYTNEKMVKELIELIPFEFCGEKVLDAGSGKNKVWYNNIPETLIKYECEIEDGCDFFKLSGEVDWVIGNPPFDIGWKFTEKAISIATKGIAFLGSIKFFNQFTPKRLQLMKDEGFELQKIHVVSDVRWYGRFYFLIFEKNKKGILSWNVKTY